MNKISDIKKLSQLQHHHLGSFYSACYVIKLIISTLMTEAMDKNV